MRDDFYDYYLFDYEEDYSYENEGFNKINPDELKKEGFL
jgi:hypothetical protein